MLHSRLVAQGLKGQLGTRNPGDEPAAIQVERLVAAKQSRKTKPVDEPGLGVETMPRNVAEILMDAGDWLPAQEVARLYGIVAGTPTEEVEPFYAELRELDESGRLLSEPIHDDTGTKVGDLLMLKNGG
jgi:type I restriction enzyme S subunit